MAQPHLRLVAGVLDGAGVRHDPPEESPILGLGRIRLLDCSAAAGAIEEWQQSTTGVAVHDGVKENSSLDRVLTALRAGFRARYQGWTPTLGKNRPVARVVGRENPHPGVAGAGEVSFGGGGAPRAVASPPQWAQRRAPGPGAGARVGILDTSIRGHRYLSGAWIGRFDDTAVDERPPFAEAGHATFISGLVLRRAPGAALHVRRLLDDNGLADSWTAAQDIVEIGRTGIDILNLSFVCYTEDGEPPMALAAAVDRLDPDIVVVAAAGNHGFLSGGGALLPAWPAALDDVIAVGAARDSGDGEPADFTPRGPWIDVLTPGENLVSTYLDGPALLWDDPRGLAGAGTERPAATFNGYAEWSGTSFAAAVLSGEIAARTRPGRITAREVCDAMLDTARDEQVKRGRAEDPAFVDLRFD